MYFAIYYYITFIPNISMERGRAAAHARFAAGAISTQPPWVGVPWNENDLPISVDNADDPYVTQHTERCASYYIITGSRSTTSDSTSTYPFSSVLKFVAMIYHRCETASRVFRYLIKLAFSSSKAAVVGSQLACPCANRLQPHARMQHV